MPLQCHGLPLTTESAEAARHLEIAILRFLAHGRDTADHLSRALAEDPGLTVALAAKGLFTQMLGRGELSDTAACALHKARASLRARGGTRRERHYVAALDAWCAGDFRQPVRHFEAILEDHPTDALAAKLSHGLRFMIGDAAGMRRSLERILPHWDDGLPGAGYLAGCYAFALEETGDYPQAERHGRRAVELAPDDSWGLHAVAHVLEMRDQPRAGIDWLSSHQDTWAGANNFTYHLFWHRALFHLALGERDVILALYDRHIRKDQTDDFRDVSNATSLLWRLEAEGMDVGRRWDELADKAIARIDSHIYGFADAHYFLGLAASGRLCHAERWLTALRLSARDATSQAEVTRRVGLDLAEALCAYGRRRYAQAVDRLLPIRNDLQCLGGSHAQRDVFQQLLIVSAIRSGRTGLARTLLAERLAVRPDNAWGRGRLQQVLAAEAGMASAA